MLEYIFFDAALRERFVAFANGMSIGCELLDDNLGMLVRVSDDLTDEQMDVLEERYDELELEQSLLMSETEGGFKSLAGFSLVLPDGSMTTVPLQSDVANRLLTNFTIDEIQALFSTVASCALDPKEKHLCKILRSQ